MSSSPFYIAKNKVSQHLGKIILIHLITFPFRTVIATVLSSLEYLWDKFHYLKVLHFKIQTSSYEISWWNEYGNLLKICQIKTLMMNCTHLNC